MSVNNILNYKVLFHNSINIRRQCEIVCAFPWENCVVRIGLLARAVQDTAVHFREEEL